VVVPGALGLRGERAAQNSWGCDMKLKDLMVGAALACLAGGLMAPAANAAATGAEVLKGIQYDQTGPSVLTPRLASGPAFFAAEVFASNPTDFDTGMMTFPGPASPITMIPDGAGGVFTTEGASNAALDAKYPTGTYTLTATNSSTSATFSASLPYYTDLPPSGAPPQLSAGTFTALQNLNPHQSLTLNFNSFTPDARDTTSETAFQIFDPLDNSIVLQNLPSSATSVFLPANTLAPGSSYVLVLSFANVIEGFGSGVPLDTLGVQNTFVSFSTSAVPEPRSWALMILGAGLAGAMLRRKRTAQA
jgi:hypothetical protein